jgi:hypothetical protein
VTVLWCEVLFRKDWDQFFVSVIVIVKYSFVALYRPLYLSYHTYLYWKLSLVQSTPNCHRRHFTFSVDISCICQRNCMTWFPWYCTERVLIRNHTAVGLTPCYCIFFKKVFIALTVHTNKQRYVQLFLTPIENCGLRSCHELVIRRLL